MGFTEERALGASVAGDSGKETAHIKPSCSLQIVHDHGNQSKGSHDFVYLILIDASSVLLELVSRRQWQYCYLDLKIKSSLS